MQNVHRYFLYIALVFIVILAYRRLESAVVCDKTAKSFGIGVGTIVLAINVSLLGGYTFGCHSLRHLIGGFRDQLVRIDICYRAYRLRDLFQPTPHVVGVDESVLGRLHRSLRAALRDGRLA